MGQTSKSKPHKKITRKRPKQFDDVHHIPWNPGARNVGERRITRHGKNYRSREDGTEASAHRVDSNTKNGENEDALGQLKRNRSISNRKTSDNLHATVTKTHGGKSQGIKRSPSRFLPGKRGGRSRNLGVDHMKADGRGGETERSRRLSERRRRERERGVPKFLGRGSFRAHWEKWARLGLDERNEGKFISFNWIGPQRRKRKPYFLFFFSFFPWWFGCGFIWGKLFGI